MSAMRRGASSSRVTSGIGFAANATKSRTASSLLFPRPWTFGAPRIVRRPHARPSAAWCRGHARSIKGRMALDFPSPEWVTAYKDAINANAEYKKAGKDWTHGVVAMVVKAEPTIGLAEDQ